MTFFNAQNPRSDLAGTAGVFQDCKREKRRRLLARPAIEALEGRLVLSGPGVAFQSATDIGGYSTAGAQLVDLNNDGKLDLVTSVTYPSQGTFFSVALGNGDGTFQSPTTYTVSAPGSGSTAITQFVIGDLNGDGNLDIAFSLPTTNAFIPVLYGKGDGTFGPVTDITIPPAVAMHPDAVGIGDFGADGHNDLVITGDANRVVILNGATNFTTYTSLSLAEEGERINIADFDGDGVPDIGIAGVLDYEIYTHLNTSTPQRVSYTLGGTNEDTVGSSVGYLNGPSQLPSVVITRASPVGGPPAVLDVFPSPGNSSIEVTSTISGIPYPGMPAVADLNGDGLADVVICSQTNDLFTVFLGNGNGSLTAGYTGASNVAGQQSVVGDVNGDGRPDIIIAGAETNELLQTAPPGLTVTTATDQTTGTGTSLREAINYAESLGGSQTITFAPALGNANSILNMTLGTMNISGSANITIVNSTGQITLKGNNTAALFNVGAGAALTVRDLTVSNFKSTGNGGAIYVTATGSLTADSDTFLNNTATGIGSAIYSEKDTSVTIRNSTFTANTGDAAVALNASSGGVATLKSNTFSNNTIGVRLLAGTLNLSNNIIANDTTTDVVVTSGTLSGSNNIIVNGTSTGLTATINANPLLNVLAYNGGLTDTMNFQAASPALDAGVTLSDVTTDQRGIARPQHGAYDIGAIEATFGAAPTFSRYALEVPVNSQPVNLAQALNPSPSGGTFSGNGVSNGTFNPVGIALGSQTITYTAPVSGTDLPGTAQVEIIVGEAAVMSSANVSISFSTPSPLEATPFNATVTITNIDDQYGNPFTPSRGSITLSPAYLSTQLITLNAQQLSQGTITVSFPMTYPTPGGPYTITAGVNLDSYHTNQYGSVNVADVAPSNLQLSATTVYEGTPTDLTGTFTDPGTADQHTVIVNWNDGTAGTVTTLPVGNRNFDI